MFKLFTIILFIFFNIPYSKEDIIIRPIRIFDNNNKNAQQDSEPAVVSKRTYQVQGPGGPITVTQIHISKSKNLGGDLNRPTPISMLSDIDSFFNDFFEQMIIGARMAQIIDDMNRKQNEAINNNKIGENKENNKNEEKKENKENNEKNENMNFELDEEDGDNKKEGKANDNVEKNSNKKENNNKNDPIKKINKKIKKLTRKITKKEIIFSRICKYIFYSIILFTVYIIGKKFLAFLEILDPDNGNLFGGKIKEIEKPKEEEGISLKEKTKTQELKNKENKQK